jgi:hypothetical protein
LHQLAQQRDEPWFLQFRLQAPFVVAQHGLTRRRRRQGRQQRPRRPVRVGPPS